MLYKNVKAGQTYLDLLPDEKKKSYVCASIDHHFVSLNREITKDGDYEIEYYGLNHFWGSKIYEASLRYLISMALKIISPKNEFRFYYNISRTLFCKSVNKNFVVTTKFVDKLNETLEKLIELDIPFEFKKVSKEEANEIYAKLGFKDKSKVFKYRKESYVHFSQAKYNDLVYSDYMYSLLVPSSGYLKSFKIKAYNPGFVIQLPRSECQGEIPEFVDERKYAKTLQSSSHWQESLSLDTLSNINAFLRTHSSMELINVCEARFNNMMADLGKKIVEVEEPIRLICIAGPSSSGKTSFSNRLIFELMAKGLKPIRISMDDYFIPFAQLKPNTSLESIDALDVELFDKQMDALIHGESVQIPIYDFKSHDRKFGKSISLDENQPIIIEGIHALNNLICQNIPAAQKYKIYIAPHSQINVDNHTPVSMTEMRLLRRIARDIRTRNTSASRTIEMWPSVREGEFKYIYPTEENANFIFDTFMPYELNVLRNIVMPELDKISFEEEGYQLALRLKNIIKYCLPIDSDDIPCNSLMREFVGGSSFKDAR